jgi:SAM-dependent methyltransferase
MKKATSYLDMTKKYTILDVGGRGLEGDRSYRSVFKNNILFYHIADILEGENVSHVMTSEYSIPANDNFYDIIVSGQTLEHVKNPFRLVLEMKRVLKPNGYIIIIAPSEGPRHDLVDCWRFMDDSFKAIAEEVDLIVVADWIDKKSEDKKSIIWKDHVFVGQKK